MTALRNCATALLLAAIAVAPAFAADTAPPPWSERGVFVFGYVGLDFKYGLEDWVPLFPYSLTNCSTKTYYCASAYIVHIVLPRTCSELKVGDSWTVGGITTIVLAEVHNPSSDLGIHAYGPATVQLLGSPAFPHTVYEYWGQGGVRVIYYDFLSDLVAMAGTAKFRENLKPHTAHGLITRDLFGPCAPPQ